MGLLSGRGCVVTGAARGIGRAIAIQLGSHGARVAVGHSQNKAAADEVVREVKAAGGEAFALPANVQRPEEVTPAIASVAERFGSIDVLALETYADGTCSEASSTSTTDALRD